MKRMKERLCARNKEELRMSLLYRAMLGVGACVLVGASHVATVDAITWDFRGDGGTLVDPSFFESDGVKATAWNYGYSNQRYSFQAATLHQVNHEDTGKGGLGVCSGTENCETVSADYQVDNAGHDDYVLFTFDSPMDQFTVRINPEVNNSGGWDLDVSYFVGYVDPSIDLAGKGYSDLVGLGFSSRVDDDWYRSATYRDVSIFSQTPVNALLLGPKKGGEYDLSDRFMITSISSVPEPSSMLLLMLGMGVIGLVSMRRNLVKG